jgi:hypothetical protein
LPVCLLPWDDAEKKKDLSRLRQPAPEHSGLQSQEPNNLVLFIIYPISAILSQQQKTDLDTVNLSPKSPSLILPNVIKRKVGIRLLLVFIFFFLAVLRFELRDLHLLNKQSAT